MILSQHQLFIALFQSPESPFPAVAAARAHAISWAWAVKSTKVASKADSKKWLPQKSYKIFQNPWRNRDRLLPELFDANHLFHSIETSTVCGLTKWQAWQFRWYTKGKKHHFWQILDKFGQPSLKQLKYPLKPWMVGIRSFPFGRYPICRGELGLR